MAPDDHPPSEGGIGAAYRDVGHDAAVSALSWILGINISGFAHEHVEARLAVLARRERFENVDALLGAAGFDNALQSRIRQAVAISVTGRGREPRQMACFEDVLLPELMARTTTISVWSAGCATGEELCEIADVLARAGGLDTAQLLGSDLLEENVVVAQRRHGDDCSCAVSCTAFEQRDIVAGGVPAGRWSIVVCRNVAIYLHEEAKRRLFAALTSAVAPGGLLLVGRSERPGNAEALGLSRVGPATYRKAA